MQSLIILFSAYPQIWFAPGGAGLPTKAGRLLVPHFIVTSPVFELSVKIFHRICKSQLMGRDAPIDVHTLNNRSTSSETLVLVAPTMSLTLEDLQPVLSHLNDEDESEALFLFIFRFLGARSKDTTL